MALLERAGRALLLAFVATLAVAVPALPAGARLGDLFAALALGALLLARRGRLLPRGPAFVAAALYVAWAAVSAWQKGAGGWKVLGHLELFAVALMIADQAARPAFRDALLRTWVYAAAGWSLFALVVALLAALGAPTGPFHVSPGALGLLFRPAGLAGVGLLAALLVPPLFVTFLDGERLLGRHRRGLLALLGLTLALTLTRTLLAIAFAAALLAGLRRRRPLLPILAGVVLAGLAFASVRLHVHGAGGALEVSGEPGIRWRIAASALHAASQHPLFGLGPGATPARAGWPRAADPPLGWDAHATPLDLAATLGIPALAAFFALFAFALRAAWRRRDEAPRRVVLCALAALAFDAATLDVADLRHTWVLFGLALAERDGDEPS
jgi:O-antigen ligase